MANIRSSTSNQTGRFDSRKLKSSSVFLSLPPSLAYLALTSCYLFLRRQQHCHAFTLLIKINFQPTSKLPSIPTWLLKNRRHASRLICPLSSQSPHQIVENLLDINTIPC